MQGGETLVQAQITRRFGQRGEQRPQGLRRHIVGDKKFGIGESGTESEGNFVRVTLVDERSRGLQFVHQN